MPKKKEEYIIVGSDNFWYASALKSPKEVEESLKHIKKHIAEYGENGMLRVRLPEKFYVFKARLTKEIENKKAR